MIEFQFRKKCFLSIFGEHLPYLPKLNYVIDVKIMTLLSENRVVVFQSIKKVFHHFRVLFESKTENGARFLRKGYFNPLLLNALKWSDTL